MLHVFSQLATATVTSTQPAASTNKGAAAAAYVREIQATLAGQLDFNCNSYGYHRYIKGKVFALHTVTLIPTMLNLRRQC